MDYSKVHVMVPERIILTIAGWKRTGEKKGWQPDMLNRSW